MKKIIIGARGSKLSQIQTRIIKNLLFAQNPKLHIEIKVITTTGDKNMNPIPLDTIGKGWFTKELDKALLQETIDLAVHSLKDLPEVLPEELCIAAIPEREDAREALISRNGLSIDDLPKGAIIGTDSTRRKAQILHKRTDLVVKSLRGNINRRLEKFDTGEYDALILAVAGLKRLGLMSRITEYFSISDLIPSPGQGALAVVSRKSDVTLNVLLQKINHQPTMSEVTAERAFSKAFGGGCKMPIGAYAKSTGTTLKLSGMVGSLDGKKVAIATALSNTAHPEQLGKKLAEQLLKKAPWYNRKRFVVVTRPEKDNDILSKQLEKIGVNIFSYPTITISKNLSDKILKNYLQDVSSFDWVVFTSKNGVRYFMDALERLKIDKIQFATKRIAAVGTTTADEIKRHKLPVHFMPSKFTTNDLGHEFPQVKGKKLLLVRSILGNPEFEKILQKKGATVITIPIYKTRSINPNIKKLNLLNQKGQISCITFTSPSTVDGFIQNLEGLKQKNEIFSLPVLSIGPVTTEAAKKHGFQVIYTAKTHTLEGMLTKLKQIIL